MAWFLHTALRRITKKNSGDLRDEGAVHTGNSLTKRDVRRGSRQAAARCFSAPLSSRSRARQGARRPHCLIAVQDVLEVPLRRVHQRHAAI